MWLAQRAGSAHAVVCCLVLLKTAVSEVFVGIGEGEAALKPSQRGAGVMVRLVFFNAACCQYDLQRVAERRLLRRSLYSLVVGTGGLRRMCSGRL
jgi:hypothetical protein